MTIAEERLDRLASLARATAGTDDALAREYVQLAKRLAERHRLELPRTLQRYTCDTCDAYLRPGYNAQIRLQDGHIVIKCDCGSITRYPYK